jgi:hypothetical protein
VARIFEISPAVLDIKGRNLGLDEIHNKYLSPLPLRLPATFCDEAMCPLSGRMGVQKLLA